MKRVSLLIYPLSILLEVAICLKGDLLINNISGTLSSLNDYLLTLILGLLLGISFILAISAIGNKLIKLLIFVSCLLPVFIPYFENGRIVISNMHIIMAYVGFALFTSLTLYILFKLTMQNKKMKIVFRLYILMLMIILVLNLYFMAINNLMELIYLLSSSLTYGYIKLNEDNFVALDCI